MPQASEEQRSEWGIMEGPVIAFLKSRGYKLRSDWCWVHPCPEHWQPTDKEASAMWFLVDEWDFGVWVPYPEGSIL